MASSSALLLPVKVLPAVDLSILVEALLVEHLPAELALDAAGVPRLVQELHEEAVEDGPQAAGALHAHHAAGRRAGGGGWGYGRAHTHSTLFHSLGSTHNDFNKWWFLY